MPTSKSKRTARAASFGGLPAHPALRSQDPLLEYRMGKEEPLRLPDAENSPSAATVLRSEYTIGSDAAGNAIWGESPPLATCRNTWTVTTGSTGLAATQAHPQYASLQVEARYARQIAMKVTVTYIGVEQESAGYLSYFSPSSGADVSNSPVDALHTGSLAQMKATEGLEVYVDYTQSPRYEEPTSADFMKATFPLAVFICSGLPVSKTSLFRVRVMRFIEYLPLQGSLAEGETQLEPHNPGAIAVHGALGGPATTIHRGGDTDWVSRLKGAANAAYHMVQPMMPYVVPKARSYLSGLVSSAVSAAPLLLGL